MQFFNGRSSRAVAKAAVATAKQPAAGAMTPETLRAEYPDQMAAIEREMRAAIEEEIEAAASEDDADATAVVDDTTETGSDKTPETEASVTTETKAAETPETKAGGRGAEPTPQGSVAASGAELVEAFGDSSPIVAKAIANQWTMARAVREEREARTRAAVSRGADPAGARGGVAKAADFVGIVDGLVAGSGGEPMPLGRAMARAMEQHPAAHAAYVADLKHGAAMPSHWRA